MVRQIQRVLVRDFPGEVVARVCGDVEGVDEVVAVLHQTLTFLSRNIHVNVNVWLNLQPPPSPTPPPPYSPHSSSAPPSAQTHSNTLVS
jgi:hypothetical protein